MVQKQIDITAAPTPEQIKMLEMAAQMPIPDDAEYPEFSAEDLRQFKRISDVRKSERQKQTIALRLSPQAINKAKSLGKGYTSVLSRIIENALDHPEIIRQFL